MSKNSGTPTTEWAQANFKLVGGLVILVALFGYVFQQNFQVKDAHRAYELEMLECKVELHWCYMIARTYTAVAESLR